MSLVIFICLFLIFPYGQMELAVISLLCETAFAVRQKNFNARFIEITYFVPIM